MFRSSRLGRRPSVGLDDNFDDDDDDDYSYDDEDCLEEGLGPLSPFPATDQSRLDELGVSRTRLHRLDLRYSEKVLSLFDSLQMFALLWSLSQPWPWPRQWLKYTRWTVSINLDVVSIQDAAMTVTGPGNYASPWGEREGYVYYAFVYSLAPIAIQILWYFRAMLSYAWLDRGAVFHRIVLGQDLPKPAASVAVDALIAFERGLLLSAHLLYLPVVLAVVRLLLCDSNGTLSVDPTTNCFSPSFALPTFLGCGVAVLFTLGLTRHTTKAAHALKTYGFDFDHERFLQRVEIEYALNLCNAWASDHLWMVSSFRKHAVRFRVYVMYVKLLLVLIYAFGRSHLANQAVVFWVVITCWTAWTCIHPPYRCRSSNRLHFVLYATLWIDTFMGMMTGYNVRNAMLVARTQYHGLSIINFAGAVLAVGVVVATPVEESLERRRQRRQLLAAAKKTITLPPKNERDDFGKKSDMEQQLKLLAAKPTITSFAAAAKNARDGSKHAKLAAAAADNKKRGSGGSGFAGGRFRNRHVIASHVNASYGTPGVDDVVDPDRWPTRATLTAMARLPRRKEWVDAIRKSKEFRFHCEMCPKGLEPIRSLEAFMRNMRVLWAEAKSEDSSLEPALSSALERLALVHARLCHDAQGRGNGLTTELENVLQDVKVLAAMRKRNRAQALMTARQKRIMLKLFAITAFLNHRDLRDSSAASVLRLRNETERVLGQPLTLELRMTIKTTCMQWKRLIQKSEREFEETHGHPPRPSDKEENTEWYESYQKLRAALDTLSASVRRDQAATPQGAGVGVRQDYHESLALTPASSESLSTLIRATELLLSTGQPPGSDVEIVEAETCLKQWKRVIRGWEEDFEKLTGGPPGVSDKQIVRSYYEYYRGLKLLLATES